MQSPVFLKLLLGFLVGILITGCNQQSVDRKSAEDSVLKPCPGFAETGYPPLVSGAECGEILVKENPDDPQSKTLLLNILRLPAISPVPEKDPLFLIQGGPGGSSVEMATQLHWVFWDVRKNRDLIFVDQRGTGKSNPLVCESLSSEQLRLPESEQQDLLETIYKNCAEKYQSIAAYYTTPYAVRDLDQVRSVLGYERVNLWGGSYGTRVALEYARQYPNRLRSMVLDGVAPVAISLPNYFAQDALAAFEKVDAHCATDDFCNRHYYPVMSKAKAVVERLQSAENLQRPLQINYQHPRYGQPAELRLTAKQFSLLIFSALYSRELSALLPQMIYEAEKGNYQLLASLDFLAGENMQKMNISDAMRYSVICNEDREYVKQNALSTSNQFLALDFVNEIEKICRGWGKARLADNYWQPVKSDVPSLLLSGGFDPVTPQGWAEETAKHLSNAGVITATGGHHGVSYQGCIPQVIAQFIERASMDSINTACIEKIQPLSPDLGAHTPEKSTEVMP
jgi:pimeloyl-ACP methyl ester carboxylesterase